MSSENTKPASELSVSELHAISKRNVHEHPYCPDEDGRCQYGRDESCPGIERERTRDMHKTRITITVLSEDPIHERMDLADIIRECDQGDYVLFSEESNTETLTNDQMAQALWEAGSDPSFFNLESGSYR